MLFILISVKLNRESTGTLGLGMSTLPEVCLLYTSEQRIKAEDADWGVVVQVAAGYPHSALPWALAPDEGPDDLS